jgi:hypothetical protein
MNRIKWVFPTLVALLAFSLAGVARAETAERWFHVKVDGHTTSETVRVNVPLSLAEAVLPAIDRGKFHNGRISCNGIDLRGVDLRAILAALEGAPNNEFVTVQAPDQDVRVAKQGGNFVVHVLDHHRAGQQVDVTVPMTVVRALVSGANDELNLTAAIHALKAAGDTALVTVHDGEEDVRIWIDSRSTVN